MCDLVANAKDMKKIILNCQEPLIFRNITSHWQLLKWDINTWSQKLGDKKLRCRTGAKKCGRIQWERKCGEITLTFEDFLNKYHENKCPADDWAYFDYKYVHEWFNDELEGTFDWSVFGFPELDTTDTTIWIGSTGAHTPCHYDTYGCNLVVQIFGEKQWILIPPNEGNTDSLRPTRIPYEESSVYSRLNLYSPGDLEPFKAIQNSRIVTLVPGDVLIIPPKWWHYVENKSTAISVNTWIVLPQNDECHVEEALVRLFVNQMATLPNFQLTEILNPNEDGLENRSEESLKYLKSAVDMYNKSKITSNIINRIAENEEPPEKIRKMYQDLKKTLDEHRKAISVITPATDEELRNVLMKNSERYENVEKNEIIEDNNETSTLAKSVINAFCNPEIISQVKRLFLDEMLKNKC